MIRSNVSKYSFDYTPEYKIGRHSTMLDSHLLKKYLQNVKILATFQCMTF